MALYFTLAEDLDIVSCFFIFHEIKEESKKKIT